MKNLINHTFGRLNVLELIGSHKNRKLWKCSCQCGNIKNVTTECLTRGLTTSCGCILKEKITALGRGLIDLTGQKFGKLLVLAKSNIRYKNRVLWECICECGNKKLHLSSTLKYNAKVVSCGCHKSELAKKNSGENHYNWKGGITDENTKDRNSQQYIDWRKAVFQKDDYTCQKCQKRGKKLNAHHIESFSSNKQLRFDINNGITLCFKCHYSFHKYYGKENNSRKQFLEFISTN